MSRRRNIYVFCLPLLMVFLCAHVQGLAMEDSPKSLLLPVNCSAAQMSAAKEQYDAGVKFTDYEERRVAFQRAVDLCPSYADAHVNLADALEKIGLAKRNEFERQSREQGEKFLDEAVKHYSTALKLNPELLAPQLGLGDVYMAQGCYPLAAETYKKILKSRPQAPNLEERLKGAERLSRSDSKEVRSGSQIISDVKEKNLKSELKTMGIENFTVADIARQSFNNIHFDGWSSAIKQGDPINQLDEIGKAFSSKDMASFKFVIEGHANKVGEFDRNMNLSNERANAVREYLIKNFGITPDRMIIQGFGYSRPKHDPATDALNRRVEIVFFNEENKK